MYLPYPERSMDLANLNAFIAIAETGS